MRVPVYNIQGNQVDEAELRDDIFAVQVNEPLMHQALLRQQANARLGTHKGKTRGQVSGGGAKPWRQKGTGRARQGTTRAPQWKGGGVVFGPHPRSYGFKVPNKVVKLAMRSVLSAKAADGDLHVVESFGIAAAPSTKTAAATLAALGL